MLGVFSTNPVDDFGKPFPLWEAIALVVGSTVWVAMYIGGQETISSQPFWITVVAGVSAVQYGIRLGRGVTLRMNSTDCCEKCRTEERKK